MSFVDERREDWEIALTLWYPATEEAEDAAVDPSAAPYPLILYSHGGNGSRQEMAYLAAHLVSHGFVFVAIEHPSDSVFLPLDIVDRPMDVLFVLDQFAQLSEGDLFGLIDTNTVGVSGYSEGGLTTLELTGAQFDLYYAIRDWCTAYPEAYPRICIGEHFVDDIRDYRALFEPTVVADEVWPPYYDERIKAAFAFVGGPGMLFGETGLASAIVPTLIMAGTSDDLSPYEWAAVYPYEHMTSTERYLISVIGGGHHFGIGLNPPYKAEVLQFATAFFGYYLQGREDYAQYLTADYVNSIESLAWGVYEGIQGTEAITVTNAHLLTIIASFRNEASTGMSPGGVAFSPDGKLIALAGENSVRLFELSSTAAQVELETEIPFVDSVAFSPDGRLLAVAGGNGSAEVWDLSTSESIMDFEHYSDGVLTVAFSPDSTRLATAWGDAWGFGPGGVKLWNLASDELVANIGLQNEYNSAIMVTPFALSFSPDGSLLAVANGDGRVLLWDLVHEQEYTVLDACSGYAYRVAFSPDETLLATSGTSGYDDGSADLRLWNVATGEQLRVFEGHSAAVKAVAFNLDGTILASTGNDDTVRLWDTSTGEMLVVLNIGYGTELAFSPDGKLLAVQGAWHTIIWAVEESS